MCEAIDGEAETTKHWPMSSLHRRYPFGLTDRNWPWFVLLAAGVLRLAGLLDLTWSPALKAWPEPLHGFFAYITDFGEAGWILIPALVLLLVCAALSRVAPRRDVRLALIEMVQLYGFIFAAVGLASLVANLLKRLIGRGRPVLFDQVGGFDFHHFAGSWTYESFPSGHSTTVFATAVAVGFLSPRWFPLALAIALLIGLSRIVVGMHYPTDVIGGALLGALAVYAVRNSFAHRGWMFRIAPDGMIVPRALAATRRLVRKQTSLQRAAR